METRKHAPKPQSSNSCENGPSERSVNVSGGKLRSIHTWRFMGSYKWSYT